jgi:hypothetical protein
MARKCDKLHAEYDRLASAGLQVGELPAWMHVTGKVCWQVYAGPYDGLGQAWPRFMGAAHPAHGERLDWPSGDVYACNPTDHPGEQQRDMITILWCSMK